MNILSTVDYHLHTIWEPTRYYRNCALQKLSNLHKSPPSPVPHLPPCVSHRPVRSRVALTQGRQVRPLIGPTGSEREGVKERGAIGFELVSSLSFPFPLFLVLWFPLFSTNYTAPSIDLCRVWADILFALIAHWVLRFSPTEYISGYLLPTSTPRKTQRFAEYSMDFVLDLSP